MANEQAAEVLNQDGPIPKDNAEELANAAAAKAGDVDPQATEKDLDDEIEGHKRLGGWQRKIKKLQEHNEILIEALRKGGGNAQAPQAQAVQEDKPPIKPKIADFTGADAWEKYEEAKDKYFEDLTDFKSKKAVENYRAETQQRTHQQTIQDGFAAQCAEAKKEFADFNAVAFSEDTPMTDAMRDAIVTSEFGARIAYYLGQNQEEAERIAKLNPVVAIREIGKIESRISGTKPAADEDKEDLPAASSRAPRPPNPVRRTTSTNHEPQDSDDWKTWERKRLAELKAKGK
jgi:hypothetical protein